MNFLGLRDWPSLMLLGGWLFVVAISTLHAEVELPYVTKSQPGESLVSGADYSHFPRLGRGKDGRFGVLYYRGLNHGSRDDEAVSRTQRVKSSAPQPLLLNGTLATAGTVELEAAAQLVIAAKGDESHLRFSISGRDESGQPLNETLAGPRSKRAFTKGRFKSVTAITATGLATGPISIGVRVVASNIEFRRSDDHGRTWSSPIVIGDGLSDGRKFHYAPALAALPDGTFIAVFLEEVIAEGGIRTLQRVSTDNGNSWGAAQPFQFSGAVPSSTLYVWGQIQATPSGRLVAMAYAGPDNWALVSDDKGRTWQAQLIVSTPKHMDYNETAVVVLTETDWLAVSRGGRRGMRQFASRDAGRSWQDMGDTNTEPSGGYVSPSLQLASCGRAAFVLWAYMARHSRSRPPPTPDSLILRQTPAASALTSASQWSREQVLGQAGRFTRRSGYPSIVIDDDCSGGVVIAGRETSPKTASIVALPFRLAR